MQKQWLVKRDLHDHGITETQLGKYLHLSRVSVSSKLGMDISPMFYNDCEQAISEILHNRKKRYAREDN